MFRTYHLVGAQIFAASRDAPRIASWGY